MPEDDRTVHQKCWTVQVIGAAGLMTGRPDRTRSAGAVAFLIVPLKLAANRFQLFQAI